jgi:hypothetical protein
MIQIGSQLKKTCIKNLQRMKGICSMTFKEGFKNLKTRLKATAECKLNKLMKAIHQCLVKRQL